MHGRSPLLRLQSDERLITLVRRGNHHAFEALVARYQARLLAFCRHMLSSKEDAEDVLQEVFAAAFNAILADDRAINVRPWLYRIARNRSLNHLRRTQAMGVDSMDVHLSEHGQTTADKVHRREEFRLLVSGGHRAPSSSSGRERICALRRPSRPIRVNERSRADSLPSNDATFPSRASWCRRREQEPALWKLPHSITQPAWPACMAGRRCCGSSRMSA